MMSTIVAALRAGAKGLCPAEAGLEMVIRYGLAYDGAPWITEAETRQGQPHTASIDPGVLLAASGPWSGGEHRLVTVAASLLGGDPVDLSEAITGLDQRTVSLVLAALSHAAGAHEMPTIIRTDDGRAVFGQPKGAMYPWPDTQDDDSPA